MGAGRSCAWQNESEALRLRIYIPAVQSEKSEKPDYFCTIDADPNSPTYSQASGFLRSFKM